MKLTFDVIELNTKHAFNIARQVAPPAREMVWVRVTDGDTYWLTLDVGLRQTALANIRLAGYDCPETNGGSAAEKLAGRRAMVAAEHWLALQAGTPDAVTWCRTEKDPDSFGRWLGTIWAESAGGTVEHLGLYLAECGLASIWPTRWRDEFDNGGK